MPVVPDASPLIALSKMERLDLLLKLFGKVILTPRVWEEAVIKGKAMGARDAAYLEKVAQERRFARARLTPREKQLVQRLIEEGGIGQGEVEVLAIAKSRDAVAILDEKGARAVAVGLGVVQTGTAGLLYEAFLHKFLNCQELAKLLEEFGKVAWVSPELLTVILRLAREVEKK